MNQNQIASLSLKLAGIYAIIQAIPQLRDVFHVAAMRGLNTEMDNGPMETDFILIGILISFGLLILVGLCFIIFSKSLARQMITKDELIIENAELTAKNIQSIAFSVVGLIMVVTAIPHFVQFAANLQALKNPGVETIRREISAGSWAYAFGMAVQVIIGLLLFFGGPGLSSLWYFLQKLRPMRII
ncbi:MAG: hypothetical protein P4L42_14910 [Desulfocapsaceae bacterium]|nr:hypothetical protein [Desulfocapsaceae bacterium]